MTELALQHSPLPAFAATAGPHDAKLVFVGEAWGQSEQEHKRPFAGTSGYEFLLMLGEALPEAAPELHKKLAYSFYDLPRSEWLKLREEWLHSAGVMLTNTLALRPPENKIPEICLKGIKSLPPGYSAPQIQHGHYLRPEYLPELDRLQAELSFAPRNLVVGLGNVASWAMLGTTEISKTRGTVTQSVRVAPGLKFLPTFHPAYVMRMWDARTVVIADLLKSVREAEFPDVRRPRREVLVNPTLDEIREWIADLAIGARSGRYKYLGVDIETGAGQIKCIGFARSASEALVIPLVEMANPGGSYWASQGEEEQAWELIETLLTFPLPKVFQNGLYDLQYILRAGFRVTQCTEDTMLLHHSLFPELMKGLGFLGSIYTSEPAWKLMRTEKTDTEKRDE